MSKASKWVIQKYWTGDGVTDELVKIKRVEGRREIIKHAAGNYNC